MRKLEIQAYTLDEAKINAFKQGITVVQDATRSWKKSGSPVLTKDMDIFAADFLEQKGMFDFEGAGIIIAIKSGTKDTRKKPYKVISSRRKGRCKLYRTIEIRLKRNHEVIGEAVNKTEALNLAKSLIRNFRENVYAKTVYNTKDIDFELEYMPSTKAEKGQYIVFGVEQSDVKLSKRKNRGAE